MNCNAIELRDIVVSTLIDPMSEKKNRVEEIIYERVVKKIEGKKRKKGRHRESIQTWETN